MGLLIVDHSQGLGPDGLRGRKLEFDTVSCCHCQAIIRVVIRGVKKAYECPYKCVRCDKPICKYCAEVLKGVCSPVMAKVEQALRTGEGWNPRHVHRYRILPHR